MVELAIFDPVPFHGTLPVLQYSFQNLEMKVGRKIVLMAVFKPALVDPEVEHIVKSDLKGLLTGVRGKMILIKTSAGKMKFSR